MGADVGFATKPELAIAMLTGRSTPACRRGGLTGDEVYGQHPGLRRFCAITDHGLGVEGRWRVTW